VDNATPLKTLFSTLYNIVRKKSASVRSVLSTIYIVKYSF